MICTRAVLELQTNAIGHHAFYLVCCQGEAGISLSFTLGLSAMTVAYYAQGYPPLPLLLQTLDPPQHLHRHDLTCLLHGSSSFGLVALVSGSCTASLALLILRIIHSFIQASCHGLWRDCCSRAQSSSHRPRWSAANHVAMQILLLVLPRHWMMYTRNAATGTSRQAM